MSFSASLGTRVSLLAILATTVLPMTSFAEELDPIAKLQADAVQVNASDWGHWGPNSEVYSSWKSHSNRLIPVYSFGMNLRSVSGKRSLYRDQDAIEKLFGYLPEKTLNPNAEYFDQTDVYRLQKSAVEAGKKRVILFVFDGMDWQTTWAAAIAAQGRVAYREGRGEGLAFQDYRGTETDFGFFVTTPHNDGTSVDVNNQVVKTPGGKVRGGFDPALIGDIGCVRDVHRSSVAGDSRGG